MKYNLLFPILLLSFIACQNENDQKINYQFKELPIACKTGGMPNLFTSEEGTVYLSWIEFLNDTTDALVFSVLENENWSTPQQISVGSDWFVNWADFPSIVANQNGQNLAAHWLQKSAAGTYDYDVKIAQSQDQGKTWSLPFIPHQDGIAAEHGFVTMLPIDDNKIFATWLDGRNTKGDVKEDHGDNHGHGHHGAMTLRGATFDSKGKITEDIELDSRICDCCQTSAAMTAEGIIVAYRDRSEREIRDIALVRQVKGQWTEPSIVFKDNWHIAGCPVNGPSIVADGQQVWIAWYTMSNEKAHVKVAFSKDSGASFQAPIIIDEGAPLGRVDVKIISKTEAIVTWIETIEKEAKIKAIKVHSNGKLSQSMDVAACEPTRQSGFPVISNYGDELVLAWTVGDSLTTIKTGILGFSTK